MQKTLPTWIWYRWWMPTGQKEWRIVFALVFFIALFQRGFCLLCVMCDTESNQGCWKNPPAPSNCSKCLGQTKSGECREHMDYDYCVVVRTYNKNGTILRLQRTCFVFGGPDNCVSGKHTSGVPVRMCYSACTTDGCNSSTQTHLSWSCMVLGLILSTLMFTKRSL